MTDYQVKLLELLVELDDICNRYGIEYYLCAETALAAEYQHKFIDKCSAASVAMFPDQAKKFLKAVKKEKKPNRMADSMCSNRRYPDYSIHYGNTETTMINLPYYETRELPMIAVTVEIIRLYPGHFGKFCWYLKMLWKEANKEAPSLASLKGKIAHFTCKTVKSILAGNLLGKLLFNTWTFLFSQNKNAKKLKIGKDTVKFDPFVLKKTTLCTFEGHLFKSFANNSEYLSQVYGEDPVSAISVVSEVPDSLCIAANIPFSVFAAELKKKQDLFDIHMCELECCRWKSKVARNNVIINRYYALVDRTKRRFELMELYRPVKDKMMELEMDGRYNELKEFLEPYRSDLHYCYKKNLGLCFDKEIFEMMAKILQMEGKQHYVEKIRSMIPPEHYQSMESADYYGDIHR